MHNIRGELVKVVDAANQTTAYRYDSFGNLVAVKDAAGVMTRNTYDLRGRKVAMADPNMGRWQYQYNALGELISQRDAKGQTVQMRYDLLGRITSRTEAEGETVWRYDATAAGTGAATRSVGKPVRVISAEGKAETYRYDSLGRLVSTQTTIDGTTYTTGQTYDRYGRLETVTYPASPQHPDGLAISNVYTHRGYLKKVTDGTTDYWTVNSRNAAGQLTQVTLGNGVNTGYRYDSQTGRLHHIATGTPAGTTVQRLLYGFDAIGNLTGRSDHGYYNNGWQRLEERFTYDNLNRLTSSRLQDTRTGTITTKHYTYDATGNLLSKDNIGHSGHQGRYHYDLSRPHAVAQLSINGTTHRFSYDANGNLTAGYHVSAGLPRTLNYTSYNKPRQIRQGSGTGATTLSFHYGAGRELFKQVVQTPTQHTTRTTVNGYYEKAVTGSLTTHTHYIKAGGETVAIYKSRSNDTQATRYLHKDHLGSITAITDHTAAVVERLSYDPWGKRRLPNWNEALTRIVAQTTDRSFTGHRYLDAVGLIHMGGRVYDPDLGRFLSADPFVQTPANPQNLNRYSYVLNNPLSYTDPSGFFFGKIFSFVKKVVRGAGRAVRRVVKSVVSAVASQVKTIAAIATAAVIGPYCAPCAGFAAGMISSGGDLKAGLIGAVMGGTLSIGNVAVRVAATAVVGGVGSVIQGGKFLSGFVSAGVSAGFGAKLGGGTFSVPKLIVTSVVGGVTSVLGGGKFKNGAKTAAFLSLFSSAAEYYQRAVGRKANPLPGENRARDKLATK